MKRFFLVAAAALALCAPALAQSNYPSKPVKLIVDSAPGSATDVINRLVSERLAQIWGQQVLTLNYPRRRRFDRGPCGIAGGTGRHDVFRRQRFGVHGAERRAGRSA
jgi:hypothetical protein